jgi:CO/xanthine dehydrogenase FAD-binding subunit
LAIYLQPGNLAAALAALRQPGTVVLAGGTDFYPALGERAFDGTIVDISAVRGLSGMREDAGEIVLGATTTWSEIVRAKLPRGFNALQQAARQVGSLQIQNRGTIAGNICNASPAADGVPSLLVLDAEVVLESAFGTRRLPLSEFVLGYRKTDRAFDEIVTAVVVPERMQPAASAFNKLGARQYLVISISMVAAALLADPSGRIIEARVAVGSCSARAVRLAGVETKLQGSKAEAGLSDWISMDDLGELSPIADVRATAEYRWQAALSLVREAVEDCVLELRR